MSGLFTPIESMPEWAQFITKLNPVTYFIDVMRRVILKGSTIHELQFDFIVVSIMAAFFNIWAVLNYKKTN
ncbi:MAG TPA: ABC transporter permease, partial [Saprospiraceae bacterium]|nr:ABC transporter permease [Saprospiraceae bacterium]